jgi:hypothetical protein
VRGGRHDWQPDTDNTQDTDITQAPPEPSDAESPGDEVSDDGDAEHPPTDDEVQADRELAAQVLAALVLAGISALGPPAALAAIGLTPIAQSIAAKVATTLSERRVRHAAGTTLDAANAAELPIDEFLERAVSDDRRHELLARTLTIAQDTALHQKRRALGRALAAGVMGDEAKIDDELLFVRAIADIDEMHIRLLARLATGISLPGWTVATITQADRGLADVLPSLLGTLELHGLVTVAAPGGFYRGPGAQETSYHVTDSGRRLLARLSEDYADAE